ncbi:MAG: hypothetical protein ABIO46_12520 [Chitinophagales bacterium]
MESAISYHSISYQLSAISHQLSAISYGYFGREIVNELPFKVM